jgi:type II secretion system protein D
MVLSLLRSLRLRSAGLALSVGFALATSALPAQDPPVGETPETAEISDNEPNVMSAGKIPVINLLRFLMETTGKVVNYPSAANDQAFAPETTVEVLGNIDPLSLPIIRAILETNGYELWEETLSNGQEIINVRSAIARTPSPTSPTTPIIERGQGDQLDNSQELATLVLQLKYTETTVVSQALRDLLDIQAGGRAGSIKMVSVPQSETLILRAKVDVLEHIEKLVSYIDVELVGPEQILILRELTYADAEDMVSIIQEALDPGTSGSVARRPARPTGRGNAAATAGAQLAGESTRMISDPRTQKIIIQSTDDAEVDLVLRLIDALDTRVRSLRRNTWTYRVKYLKAEDLADVLRQLIEGTQGSLRGNNRTSRTSRTARSANQGVQQQIQTTPTRIVPHPETNSLIIQAEPEEWREISRILEEIVVRGRQVFLEAALVQVNEGSTMNYTIEFLAGNLDDQATRLAAMSALGISTLDVTQLPDNFARTFTGDGSGRGLLAAISSEGQLPVLLQALKEDTESKILATPFILADDNEQSSIEVNTEVFFDTSTIAGSGLAQGNQGSESAGIRLSLTPTISREVVLMELELEVSSFAEASSGGANTPDRSSNTIISHVTIPDGSLFIIGGLARESESVAVSKVPVLGDLPLICRFFQSRGSSFGRENLYIFLTAHIIDEERSENLELLSDQAIEGVRGFGEVMRLNQFELPDDPHRDPQRNRDENTGAVENPNSGNQE